MSERFQNRGIQYRLGNIKHGETYCIQVIVIKDTRESIGGGTYRPGAKWYVEPEWFRQRKITIPQRAKRELNL